jgi:hypothetical protein
MSFARDPATAEYDDRRADEYDDWYATRGRFEARERPGWGDEVAQLVALLAALPVARTLDVACGKRSLTEQQLAAESDGEPRLAGRWFVAAMAQAPGRCCFG